MALLAAPARTGATAPEPAPPDLVNLDPGGRVRLHQDVPVTIVYVGLEAGGGATGIDAPRVEGFQPSTYVPIIRTATDPANATIGLDYAYAYESVFADQAFEDAFFTHLASIAQGPSPPTSFQAAYSAQALAAQQITETWVIDATAAESWLATNAGPMLGVDTERPTVFFVNWFGRADFRFHTYVPFRDIPGTDLPPGSREADLVTGYGGSTPDDAHPIAQLARVWFYDVSAGPDQGGAGWQLTTTELDAYYYHDGIPDHRMPPVWEYGTAHWYRPFDDLSADLALILRFVAINLLFTSSPLYHPALSPPLLADDVQLDLTVVDGDPDVDPLARLHPEAVTAAFAALDPSRRYTHEVAVVPFDAGVREGYACARSGAYLSPFTRSCYLEGAEPFYDLDLFADTRRAKYLDGQRYELPMMMITLPTHWTAAAGWAGLAAASQYGPQRWALAIMTPRFYEVIRLPPANLLSHEAGHHLAFSHPHDGYDSELDIHYGAYNEFFFATIGDNVSSTMSYHEFTEAFSQFNRDDLDRWMSAVRLQWANRILADVYASPLAGRAAEQLAAADELAGQVAQRLAAWDLRGASAAAGQAYALVVEAAGLAEVAVEPWSGRDDQGRIGYEAWIQDPVLDAEDAQRVAGGAPADRLPPMPEPGPDRPEPPGVPDQEAVPVAGFGVSKR